MVTGFLLQACDKDPAAPLPEPFDPGQTELLGMVRRRANEHGFRSLNPPPAVRHELVTPVTPGRALAFDRILSGNRDVSCMTCHPPELSTGDGKSLPVGQGGTGLGPSRSHPDGQFTLRWLRKRIVGG